MRRLLCGALCFLVQDTAELARIDLLRILTTELAARQYAEHHWREHHEQFTNFLTIQSARLLDTLLNSVGVSAEDAAENTAGAAHIGWRSCLKYRAYVVRYAIVRGYGLLNCCRALWL